MQQAHLSFAGSASFLFYSQKRQLIVQSVKQPLDLLLSTASFSRHLRRLLQPLKVTRLATQLPES